MSTIVNFLRFLKCFARDMQHRSHNYLLGCQMVQLDPFSESKMAAIQRDFGQYLTLDLESCNTTFYGLSRAASPFLTLVLQLGHQNPTWPQTYSAK